MHAHARARWYAAHVGRMVHGAARLPCPRRAQALALVAPSWPPRLREPKHARCLPWPAAPQVFEDRNGSIVMSFDRARAITEGDLSSYMNTLAKASPMAAAYRLFKDASQWGLVDEETQAVFYVMWPPWVRHRCVRVCACPCARVLVRGT
jgi:hypothetical protein